MRIENASQTAKYVVVQHVTKNDPGPESPPAEDSSADQAGADPDAETASSWNLRGTSEMARAEVVKVEKVVAFQPGQDEPEAAGAAASATAESVVGPHKRDWSAALDLVQEACEAIRISEERVAEVERESQHSALQAREELKALQSQINAAERRAQNAEARAQKAEARAVEAEGWLARIHDAITVGFGRAPAPFDADV